jgi:hypothetical protein
VHAPRHARITRADTHASARTDMTRELLAHEVCAPRRIRGAARSLPRQRNTPLVHRYAVPPPPPLPPAPDTRSRSHAQSHAHMRTHVQQSDARARARACACVPACHSARCPSTNGPFHSHCRFPPARSCALHTTPHHTRTSQLHCTAEALGRHRRAECSVRRTLFHHSAACNLRHSLLSSSACGYDW